MSTDCPGTFDCPCGGRLMLQPGDRPVEECDRCGAAHAPVQVLTERDRRNIRELARVVHGMAVRGELP